MNNPILQQQMRPLFIKQTFTQPTCIITNHFKSTDDAVILPCCYDKENCNTEFRVKPKEWSYFPPNQKSPSIHMRIITCNYCFRHQFCFLANFLKNVISTFLIAKKNWYIRTPCQKYLIL